MADNIRFVEADMRQMGSRLSSVADFAKRIAKDMAEVDDLLGTKSRLDGVEELMAVVKSAAQTKHDLKVDLETYKEFEKKTRTITNGNGGDDDEDNLIRDELFDEILAEFQTRMVQPNLDNDPDVKQLLTILKLPTAGEDEGEDLVLETSGPEKIPVDALTKKEITDPVRNKTCRHTYERETIYGYIDRTTRPRCPFVGCNNRDHFKKDDLEDDVEMQNLISRVKNMQ